MGGLVLCLAVAMGWGQTQPNQPPADQKQEVPDAPSAVRPPQPFPTTGTPPQAPDSQTQPTAQPTPQTARPAQPGDYQPPPTYPPGEEPQPAPPFNVKTVPQGGAKLPVGARLDGDNSQDQLYTLVVRTNQVIVPVRVTDASGRMVEGLVGNDFAVYEDGKKQKLNYFSPDPFALSAAVILDLGMPDATVQKVNKTFSALEGAFGPYDELELYTYSSSTAKVTDFGAVGKRLDAALDQLKYVTGANNGPPTLDGQFGPQGPTVNGKPIDPNVPHVTAAPPQESHVLNDAILAAAIDLSKRDKARRKIIFVISDGRELHSTASYRDVLKVLQTNGIAVYAIGVGSAALPGYGKLARLHLPRMGYTDILPKYASATAGEYITDSSRDAIETAYAKAMGEARNQYTLGYATAQTVSEACRDLEVTVARPPDEVKVFAKAYYCPAPPVR
jgi:VWFA-related protein